MSKRECQHFAIAMVVGQPHIIRRDMVEVMCKSMAKLHYVCLGDPPDIEVEKYRKMFAKFPYCPKCGKRTFSKGKANGAY